MLKTKRKKILIISHYYYPDNRVGAKRFGNLVEIFERKFSEIHVLTIPKNQIPIEDPSLFPSGVLHYAPMIPPPPPYPKKSDHIFKRALSRLWERHLCMIDRHIGWLVPAVIKAIGIIKTNKIDVVIATSPPFVTLIVGALASFLTGKKLILDYRDPWTTLPRKYPKPFGKLLSFAMEKFSVNRANAIVFCSEIMKNDFIKVFPIINNRPYYVLTNGFNDSYESIIPSRLDENKIVMLYAGNFYQGRRIDLISEALSNLKKNKFIGKDNFVLYIFGKVPQDDIETINYFKIRDLIKIKKTIPYHDVLRYMKGSDFLFLPSAKEHKYAIPYKFFDYLMVRQPILAVGPKESAIEKLMNNISCGYYCPIGRNDLLEKFFLKLFKNNFKSNDLKAFEFTWPSIGKSYYQIIEEL